MGSVRIRCVLVALGFAANRGSAQSQGVSIEHKPVACVVADRFPLVEARVEPAAKVARARVLFRAAGTPDWYFVEMKPEQGVFHGTLPKPLKATKQIEYYIDAMGQGMEERRTAEYAPAVVSGAGECPSKMLTAAVLTSAKLAIGSITPGVTALPAGFSSIGIVGGSVAGTAAGAGASSGAAAGGGALKTVLIIGGVAVAGGAAVAVKQATQDDVVAKSYAIEAFALKSFNPRVGVQGAIVSSSLDSVTTTTDAQGRFILVPTTPCLTTRQPRGNSGGVEFTVTIGATSGCPAASFTKQWGCASVGQFPPQDLNMNLNLNCR